MDKNIVLVGFMGTGKTVVARKLASDLGMRYVSIDDLIEEREKRSIKDIFVKNGEPYFREIEKIVVRNVSEGSCQVIDPGGGVVLNDENIVNLKKKSLLVCLWADPATIHERTRGSLHRPLLNVEDPMSRIKMLMEERGPFYRKADLHVETDGLEIDQIAEIIKRMINEEKK